MSYSTPHPTTHHLTQSHHHVPLITFWSGMPWISCPWPLRVLSHWAIAISIATSQTIGFCQFLCNHSHLATWNIKEKFRDRNRNRSVGMDHKSVHSVDKNSNQLQLSITPGLILSLCLLRWPRNKVMIHKYFIHTCNIIVICIISIHCTMLSPSHL